MFTIIGGDGKEYGPVSEVQLREWIAGGRANLETRARRDGETDYKRLADFPEFGSGAPPPLGAKAVDGSLADRGVRFGAYFIDGVFGSLAGMPGFLMVFTAIGSFIANSGGQPPTTAQQILTPRFITGCAVILIGWLVLMVIQAILLTKYGQTLGKRIVKIRIVRLSGENPGFVYAFLIRGVVTFILSAIPLFGLGFVFLLVDSCFIFRDDRRCLHDLMAGTKVVKC